jgi:biotin carboxylase
MIRRKDLQAVAARQWGIPTHKITNVDDAMAFAASLYQGGVVLKYNAGAAGYEMEFISKSDTGYLRRRLQERLASIKPGPFGEVDDLILQPHIIGREYFLNSLLVDSHFYPTALSRYYRIHWGEKGLYFINTFLSLTTPEAVELRQIAKSINDSQGHHNGMSHLEFIVEESTGRIYLLENNARVAGAGVPMLERAVYGISQLDLNILRVLDPERLKIELAKLPRERLTNGLMFVIPSPMDGQITQPGVDFLTRLPTYFEMPAHYRPVPGPVKKTKDLYSAIVFHQSGEAAQLQTDVRRIISTLKQGSLFTYSTDSLLCRDNLLRAVDLMEALRTGVPQVDWAALK